MIVIVLIFLGLLSIFIAMRKKLPRHPSLVYVTGYPIIGVLLNFLPASILDTAKEYPIKFGPFVEFYILNKRGLFVTDIEIAKEIMMKRPKTFRRLKTLAYSSKIVGTGDGLFQSNGTLWNHLRKATAPSFSNMNVISKMKPIAQELFAWMDRLTEESKKNSKQEINMKFQSFSLTIRAISIVAFGLDTSSPVSSYFYSATCLQDIETILKFTAESALFFLPRFLWKYTSKYQYELKAREAVGRFTKACQQIIDYKRQLIQQQGKAYNTTSMIDSMLMKRKDLVSNDSKNDTPLENIESALTDEEIISNVKTVYMAGSDTTSIIISWISYYFAIYPHYCQQVREEFLNAFSVTPTTTREDFLHDSLTHEQLFSKLALTFACVKETCRVTGPASTNGMELETDPAIVDEKKGGKSLTLSNGIVINPEDIVWINFEGIHLQEKIFPDPHAFKPERWLIKDPLKLNEMENNFLAFGYGPRVCPGMTLAYYEATLAVAFLAYHFDFELNCPKEEVYRVRSFASTPSKVPVLLKQVNRFQN